MSYLAAEPLLPLEKHSPAVRLFGSATICYRQDNNKMTAMLSERESPQGSFQALDEITYKETLQGGVFYFANRRSGKKKVLRLLPCRRNTLVNKPIMRSTFSRTTTTTILKLCLVLIYGVFVELIFSLLPNLLRRMMRG